MNSLKLQIFIYFVILLCSCSVKPKKAELNKNLNFIDEVKLTYIELKGDIANKKAEISGLAWKEDNLVLLPQFPNEFSDTDNGIIWEIPEQQIGKYLSGETKTPITPEEIIIDFNGLMDLVNSTGGGFESIVFVDSLVFLTIEAVELLDTKGYLVSGIYDKNINTITLTKNSVKELKSQSNEYNYADETILYVDGRILTFHEANGTNINPNPVAYSYDINKKVFSSIGLENIEYRITDATEVDTMNNFWVINYLYPGEINKLKLSEDIYQTKFGIGKTHLNSERVERLIELNYSEYGISKTETPPIYLELDNDESRNWEGIVRYKEKGFIIVTDYYPETVLAFVPYKN